MRFRVANDHEEAPCDKPSMNVLQVTCLQWQAEVFSVFDQLLVRNIHADSLDNFPNERGFKIVVLLFSEAGMAYLF
jgi:hypothetical protein